MIRAPHAPRPLLLAASLLLSFAGARVAGAQQPAPAPAPAPAAAPSDADRARAKALIRDADVSYRMFKFDQALADYQEAYRLSQHPAIAFNIAQTYRQLKDYEKARFYYKLFLSDWRKKSPDTPPPYEAEVQGHIARLTKLIAEKARRPGAARPQPVRRVALARVELEGLRPGARVLVDGAERRGGPLLTMPPGERRLRVELDGFYPWDRSVTVQAGELVTQPVELRVVDHRLLWLCTSAALTGAAAGLLAMGIHYNVRHDRFILETPEADESRRLSVIGYAAAGGAAALAAASWTIYWLHRRKVLRLQQEVRGGEAAATAVVTPVPGGALAAGTLRF